MSDALPYGLTLRKALPEDAEQLKDFVRACFAKWVPVIGREPLPMTADYAEAIAKNIIEIGEMDKQMACMLELEEAHDHLMIETVAVSHRLQGKGIGRFLMARAEDHAREHGFAELQLLTNVMMQTNRVLYARLGYEEYEFVDREDGLPGGVRMRKRLI